MSPNIVYITNIGYVVYTSNTSSLVVVLCILISHTKLSSHIELCVSMESLSWVIIGAVWDWVHAGD